MLRLHVDGFQGVVVKDRLFFPSHSHFSSMTGVTRTGLNGLTLVCPGLEVIATHV